MPGSASLTVAFLAPHFAARGADVEAELSEDEQGHVLAAPGNVVVVHRAGALVFIQADPKRPRGSEMEHERVFIGQLMEPVIREIAESKHGPRTVYRIAKPKIRYFSVAPGRYQYDRKTAQTVAATAIYGGVEHYSNPLVNPKGGLLMAFTIEQDDLDRMEEVINDVMVAWQAEKSESESPHDEEEPEALTRKRKEDQLAKRFTVEAQVLAPGAKRNRQPTHRLNEELTEA